MVRFAIAFALALLSLGVGPESQVDKSLASATLQRAVFEVFVDRTNVGTLTVWIGNGDIWVPLSALRQAGLDALEPSVRTLEATEYASLRHSKPTLAFEVDEIDLTITIRAPPTAHRRTVVDIGREAPPGIWRTEEPNIYLSYAPRMYNFTEITSYSELGFSVGDYRATTGANFSNTTGTVRLLTQLVLSEREQAREYNLGDTFVNMGTLGGSLVLGGVSVSRNFALNPYLVRVPPLGFVGTALAPAQLAVYVNDQLVRRIPVAPGEFSLRGLSPTAGAGTVRYVLRDAMGNQSSVEQGYYSSSALLTPGLSDYTFALGFRRKNYGVESFNYGKPLLLGRYRLGVTSGLSTGLRLELSQKRYNFGSELVLAGPLGEFELASGVSADFDEQPHRGVAGFAAYRYQGQRLSLSTYVRITSDDYANSSLEPESNRNRIDHGTSASLGLGRAASLGAQVGYSVSRDLGARHRQSLLVNLNLASTVTLQTTATRTSFSGSDDVYEVFSSLSLSFGQGHFGRLSSYATEEGLDATMSVSQPIMEASGIGYQASATLGKLPRQSAQLRMQNQLIRAEVSYINDGVQEHTSVNAAGSLVWLPDTGIFLSRPVNQAFAVVNVGEREGLPILLNRRNVGETDANGQLFIPDLVAYQVNRIGVDSSHLPIDEEVSGADVLLSPPLKGGAHVLFELRRLQVVRGSVRPAVGSIELVRYGEMTLELNFGSRVSPVGAEGEFEFEQLPVGDWPGRVDGKTTACHFTLRVPEPEGPIQDIGIVSCKVQSSDPKANTP